MEATVTVPELLLPPPPAVLDAVFPVVVDAAVLHAVINPDNPIANATPEAFFNFLFILVPPKLKMDLSNSTVQGTLKDNGFPYRS